MMKSEEIRQSFLTFFKAHDHTEVAASSLIPDNDPSVLFTTAGMQQFKPYYLESRQAPAKNVMSVQPVIRTSDIDEVGDDTHLTYFEMLGNFSFGGYGKEQAIELAVEWLRSIGIAKDDIEANYFGGEEGLAADEESKELLLKTFSPKQVNARGKEDNFWGPTGESGPCGPTVEFHVRGVEIWNLVFNEYFFDGQEYSKLVQLGVDTGSGLERVAKVVQGVPTVFDTDVFAGLLKQIGEPTTSRSGRIIADHVRAIDALVAAGLEPSNKDRGYILRRLIRRAVTHAYLLGKETLVSTLVENRTKETVGKEEQGFLKTLKQAIRKYQAIKEKTGSVSAQVVFDLVTTYGLPAEVIIEIAGKDNLKIDAKTLENLMEEHRIKSRAGIEKKFKGGLVEVTDTTTRLHTAHHLLLAALRQVLGDHVVQRGSNITDQRLRIDFVHPTGVQPAELRQVESMVNEKIGEDLLVTKEEMRLNEAYQTGALGEFGATYPETVTVYSIINPDHSIFSREICGGPHAPRTGKVGRFKIIKEEASSSGVRRIRAVVE